jgi:hypothetical protein
MVMYYMPSFYYLVIDQQNLDQGLISIVTFALYRKIEHEIRVKPYQLVHLISMLAFGLSLLNCLGAGSISYGGHCRCRKIYLSLP